jgi:hypothetical protein
LLTSLIDNRLIELENLKKSEQKARYSYLLTPKGIREKYLISKKFLVHKKIEFRALKEEIDSTEKALVSNYDDNQ